MEVTEVFDSTFRDAAAVAGAKVAEVTQVVAEAGNRLSQKARHVRFGEVEIIEVENLKNETRALTHDTRISECSNCELPFIRASLMQATKLDYYCPCCHVKWQVLSAHEAKCDIVLPSGLPYCRRLEDPLIRVSSEIVESSIDAVAPDSQMALAERCANITIAAKEDREAESNHLLDHAFTTVYQKLMECDMLKVCLEQIRTTLDSEVDWSRGSLE